MRRVRRFLLFTVGAFLLSLLALVSLAYIYQDKVVEKLVGELNAHLKVPVRQSGIELTLIKRFPQASLRISDVLINEVRTDSARADTLLYARDLYLEFGLLSLLRGDYTISRLHGDDVRARPGIDANGAQNWTIWKSDSTASDGTSFALKRATFTGLFVRYRDARSMSEVAMQSDKLSLAGHFRPDGSSLSAEGDLALVSWSDAKGMRMRDRKADVKLAMTFGGADGAFRIVKGEVSTGSAPLNTTLAVTPDAAGSSLDLRVNGFNIALADIAALLPEELHRRLSHYAIRGEADLAIHYNGPLHDGGPALSAGITMRDGRFKETASGTVFRSVRGEMALDLTPGGDPRKLTVKGFYAEAASGTVRANCELNGLKDARLRADLHADIALADLLRFVRLDTLEQADGRLKVDANVLGKLHDITHPRATDLRALTITGAAELRGAALKLRGVRHRISALDALLALNGNDATVKDLHCDLQGNHIELKGTLHNLMPALLFADQRLSIEANARSPRLDLASLFTMNDDARPAVNTKRYAMRLPSSVDLDLRMDVSELVFEDFSAQHITGRVLLKDRMLTVDPLSFGTANGGVLAMLVLDGRADGAYPLTINADCKGMDITALFREFHDFGQGFIGARHLAGTIDSRITLTSALTPALDMDLDGLRCVADIGINNGRIHDHAPLLQVADYVKANKLIAPFVDTDALRERLRNVTFAHLEDRIEIKDRTVMVPQLTVSSSAMDINVSGSQGFAGSVDDHIDFRLGDLLKTARTSTDEFGPVADDGTGLRIFLHVSGTTSDLHFSNDNAVASARRKEKLKQETAQLKTILKDIWHGNAKEPEPVPHDARIIIDGGSKDSALKDVAQQPKKKGLGRLLEKNAKDDEQEKVIVE